ncbi:hypothetical protein BDQ17DRAFT_1370673 [Cyathus striatus]|nr:hypothetical protein BDQ17DRAFT_1370673 [Cyathus striatus]
MSDTTPQNAFTLTDADINLSAVLALACTIPGTCISFLALLAYSVVVCFKRSRAKLDRVSFRLMVYTLVFNILFGIAYAATPASPGVLCNFGAFAVNFTLSFSTFFTTCIALNLQLVLVHGVNGKKMEKYYIAATTILSIVLNVPTYAVHQFGYNEDTGTCWYSNTDPRLRLKWIIGTQSFWIILAATVETICSCVVLGWIYRFQRITSIMIKVSTRTKPPQIKEKTRIRSSDNVFRPVMLVARDKRYRRVVLRIAMYPIVSLIVNYTTVILDLNMTVRGFHTQRDFNLLILDLIFYGIRPLAYGVLAITDPAFVNAVRELRGTEVNRNGHRTNSERTVTQLDFASAVQSTADGQGAVSQSSKEPTHSSIIPGNTEESGESRTECVESGGGSAHDEDLWKFESQL